jgi:hypothetical protein
MDWEPTAQMLRRRRTTTVERQVTASEGRLSLWLRVDEVTVSPVAAATPAIAMESCAELELGAHIAGMRCASQRVQAAPPDRSPLSEALVPRASRWTSVTPWS